MAKNSSTEPKARTVFHCLACLHPDAKIALNFSSPFELLVATVLSAQCTDVRVNQITEKLFKVFRVPEDYVERPIGELEGFIRSGGFFRQKARSLRGIAERILGEYQGSVPQTMEALTTLPGVGRKTANVILGNAFGVPGLPVDTHVRRLSNRLGISQERDPVKIEHELNRLLPPEMWTQFSHLLIFHGRRVCRARRPSCSDCPLTDVCDYFLSKGETENG